MLTGVTQRAIPKVVPVTPFKLVLAQQLAEQGKTDEVRLTPGLCTETACGYFLLMMIPPENADSSACRRT